MKFDPYGALMINRDMISFRLCFIYIYTTAVSINYLRY